MEEKPETSEMNIFLMVLSYSSEEGGPREICSQDFCTDTQRETLSVRRLLT